MKFSQHLYVNDGVKPFLIKKVDIEEGQLGWHVIKLNQDI
jgi:hypothetical protein